MIDSMGFDAAVEVGIAAFCAGEEPPGDEDVWERLTGAGVESWLAERLLIFLPMAYTRRLLPDVSYPDGLVGPGGRVSLAAEPVFVAASDRAQRAGRDEVGRDEVGRIAVRSSEFDVINKALHAGTELSDLMIGETTLVEDLEPVEQGDGGIPSPGTAPPGATRSAER
ncbi:MAG: hypothetical protein ACRDP6_19450 [Actinoallomurus sp.]